MTREVATLRPGLYGAKCAVGDRERYLAVPRSASSAAAAEGASSFLKEAPMTEERLLWFLDLVDRARQGDAAAKDIFLVILETERRPVILSKLSDGDVRPVDRQIGRASCRERG